MLLAIVLACGGTFVLRKNKTPLAVGFLLGVVVMMCINMLVLVALLDQEATNCEDLNNRLGANEDTCLAVGCQQAFYQPATAEAPSEENDFMNCCRAFTAVKYGLNANEFRYEFGVGDQVNSANYQSCPTCN